MSQRYEKVKASELKIGDHVQCDAFVDSEPAKVEFVVNGTKTHLGLTGRLSPFEFSPDSLVFRATESEPADPARILVTACKLIANDETIKDGQTLAGYLLQLTRCGGAKPYEVVERTVKG